MNEQIIRITNGAKSLPGGRSLLEGLNLEIERGTSTAIVGRSGSGKSSLLAILGHLDHLDSGEYELAGQLVNHLTERELDRSRAEQFGFVFQRFALIPHLSALENVILPLRHLGGRSPQVMKQMGRDALESVDLADLASRLPRRLSGGEQQRVAIARALVHGPEVVLADEPTGSLDQATGANITEILLRRMAELGTTLVVVTHDLQLAHQMDAVFVMENLGLTNLQPGLPR
jgi:putative ABC transport system ATP-binding protein